MTETMYALVVGGCVLLVLGLQMLVNMRIRRRRTETWRVIAQGEFDRAEYGEYAKKERTGSMVHTTHIRHFEVTAIFLSDGRSYVLDGRRDMPYPKGTRLKIWRNCYGEAKIERI